MEQFLRSGSESGYTVRGSGTPGGFPVVESTGFSTTGPATSCGASPPAEAVLRLGLRPTGGDPKGAGPPHRTPTLSLRSASVPCASATRHAAGVETLMEQIFNPLFSLYFLGSLQCGTVPSFRLRVGLRRSPSGTPGGIVVLYDGLTTSLKGAGRRAPQAHSHRGIQCSLRVSVPAAARPGHSAYASTAERPPSDSAPTR